MKKFQLRKKFKIDHPQYRKFENYIILYRINNNTSYSYPYSNSKRAWEKQDRRNRDKNTK